MTKFCFGVNIVNYMSQVFPLKWAESCEQFYIAPFSSCHISPLLNGPKFQKNSMLADPANLQPKDYGHFTWRYCLSSYNCSNFTKNVRIAIFSKPVLPVSNLLQGVQQVVGGGREFHPVKISERFIK
jgi:hypothetical protein